MNTAAVWGWVGGLAGAGIGLVGGAVGTYFSIRNTNGPRERAFMVKSAVVCWIAILVFLGLLLGLPDPVRWFMWLPYAVLLPLGIVYGNRRQQAIRQQESPNQLADGTTLTVSGNGEVRRSPAGVGRPDDN